MGALPKDQGSLPFDLAWEPLKAIRAFAEKYGLPATPATAGDIKRAHDGIRITIDKEGFGTFAKYVKISYGGSASPDTAESLLSMPEVGGLLVGTASWDVNQMFQMVKIAERLNRLPSRHDSV